MKNYILGVNIALIIGVAVLFYLHFSSQKLNATGNTNVSAGSGSFKIAYFEMDSVQNQFEYFKEVRSELNAKDQELGRELSQLENNFRTKYQDLQKTGNTLSQAEVANRQQELVELDKNLKNKKQIMDQEMQDEQFKKLQDVKKKIEDYLKEFNKNKSFAYIFANMPEMNMYYKDTMYNVTIDVVKGLNETYKKKK
jgi:outer membrane protein